VWALRVAVLLGCLLGCFLFGSDLFFVLLCFVGGFCWFLFCGFGLGFLGGE